MIFIDNTKKIEEDNIYRLRIPINTTEQYGTYTFVLLNLQSKKEYEFNELQNYSYYPGYFEFYIEAGDVNDGTYYYQVFGDTEYLCTTGLCRKTTQNIENNEIISYIEDNIPDIVYQG